MDGRVFDHSCGQCMPCRIKRRQSWTLRIELEALRYTENVMVTLTYNDEHLPEGNNLVKKDLQDYFKRLRKKLDFKFRYFACGEYGDKKGRAHYHFIGFDMGIAEEQAIRDAWTLNKQELGFVSVGLLRKGGAAYVAAYTTKKLSSDDLQGREPEFALQSKYPPLGVWVIPRLVAALERTGYKFVDDDYEGFNIPQSIRHGGRILPLDMTMKNKILDEVWANKKSYGKKVGTELALMYKHRKMLSDPIEGPKYFDAMEESYKRAEKIGRRMKEKTKL